MDSHILEAPKHVGSIEFLTENERTITEFLKDRPKQYREILNALSKKEKEKIKRSTVNKLLKKMEVDHKIFKVDIDGKSFYRLDVFPFKVHVFFKIADETKFPDLLEVKNDVLRYYPKVPFKSILKKYREYLELAKPNSGIISMLKMFENSDISYWPSE